MSRMSATDRPDSPARRRGPRRRPGRRWTARGRRVVADRQHAAGPAPPHRAPPGSRDPRQARVAQPGRVGEGSRRRLDDPRGPAQRRAGAGQDAARRLVRQYRHRAGDARRRPGLHGQAVRAVERLERAQAAARHLRRRRRVDQPARRIGRRHPRGAAAVRARARRATSTPISTATRPTGGRTTTRPPSRSWPRPAGASRTSSPASARAARSWAPAGGCGRRSPRCS